MVLVGRSSNRDISLGGAALVASRDPLQELLQWRHFHLPPTVCGDGWGAKGISLLEEARELVHCYGPGSDRMHRWVKSQEDPSHTCGAWLNKRKPL